MAEREFPRRYVGTLQELGARLLDRRKVGTASEPFARELLAGFFETCMHAGLDRVLAELEQGPPPVEISDASALADHPSLLPALVAQLDAAELDAGGPRNAKPRQVVDCLVAALGLTLADETSRPIQLDDRVHKEVTAALAGATEVDLAVPRIRELIIADARARLDAHHHAAFDKICTHLDERGVRLLKQPKVPLDAMQASQRALFEARNAVIDRIARAAIDRAKDAIACANADAAARIDSPITLRLTPRDVAILRACDARVPKTPAAVAASLLQSLSELAQLTWRAKEIVARPYAASATFAVGDVLEHPKFGRGTVVSTLAQRIDVEFADGKHTLVHMRK